FQYIRTNRHFLPAWKPQLLRALVKKSAQQTEIKPVRHNFPAFPPAYRGNTYLYLFSYILLCPSILFACASQQYIWSGTTRNLEVVLHCLHRQSTSTTLPAKMLTLVTNSHESV